MAFEIPIDIAYFNHPKTLHLIAILKKPEADVYPLRLWGWAASYARDGQLPSDSRVTEKGLRWKGVPGSLVAALVLAGFIEKDGTTIHDWNEHIGRAIRIYELKKQKQRDKYDREKGILPEESRKNSGSIPPIRDTQDRILNSTQEGIQKDGPRPVISKLTQTWNSGPGLHLNGDKAASQIQAAMDVGVDPQKIEQAFMDHTKIKGMKLWDVLDPLRPKNGSGSLGTSEILAKFARGEIT
jgi:hypothetical protein